jgi:hypothetical protein
MILAYQPASHFAKLPVFKFNAIVTDCDTNNVIRKRKKPIFISLHKIVRKDINVLSKEILFIAIYIEIDKNKLELDLIFTTMSTA